jgi:hypothetical protein
MSRDLMSMERNRPLRLQLGWMGVTLLGWAVAAGLTLLLQEFNPGLSTPALFFALLLPGVAQWLILRRLFAVSPVWIATLPLATIAFVGIILSVPPMLWETVDSEAPATLAGLYAIPGALLGWLQWLTLRRRVRAAWVWIAANVVGVAGGMALALVNGLVDRSGAGAFLVVVLVYAAATGASLVWLVAQPGSASSERLAAA